MNHTEACREADPNAQVPPISGLGDLSEPMADLFLTLVAVFLVVLVPRASAMLQASTAQQAGAEEPPPVIWLLPSPDHDGDPVLRTPMGDVRASEGVPALSGEALVLVAAPGVTASALLDTAALLQGAGIEVTVAAGDSPPSATTSP